MDFATRVLVSLSNLVSHCYPPSFQRYKDDFSYSKWQMKNAGIAYDTLYNPVQTFQGKTILDLGCGEGGKTVYYATKKPKLILGIDIDKKKIGRAISFARYAKVQSQCYFVVADAENCALASDSFDIVLSEDSFEHYPHPEAVLREIRRLLRPGGLLLLTFSTYYHPLGHHLYDFIRLPWAHLVFSDDTLINATRVIAGHLSCKHANEHRRETFKGLAEREIYQFQHYINKITLAKFHRIIMQDQGWKILTLDLHCRGAKFPIFKLPILEELFNNIFCVLQKI